MNYPTWHVVLDDLPNTFSAKITSGMFNGTTYYISDLYIINDDDFEYKIINDVVYDNMVIGISNDFDALHEITTLQFFEYIKDKELSKVALVDIERSIKEIAEKHNCTIEEATKIYNDYFGNNDENR